MDDRPPAAPSVTPRLGAAGGPGASPAGRWRRTPPAIFPPLLGLFGLGIAWRRAGDVAGLPAAPGELLLGAATLLYLFCLLAWLSKPLRRPGIVLEELRVLPGRAGLAAMVMAAVMLGAALVPYAPGLALAVTLGALGLHLALAALVAWLIATGPEEGRVVTPVWHLLFVGFILGPLALVPLGQEALARAILFATMPVAAVIWAISAVQLVRRIPPAPLRPLLAIHLAPASLLATAATLLGMSGPGLGFALLALAILAALLLAGRWITTAGFSALWGAFTFPLAACAGALWAVSQGAGVLGVLAAVVLAAATLAIPPIVWKVLQAWAKGGLPAQTNAAEV